MEWRVKDHAFAHPYIQSSRAFLVS